MNGTCELSTEGWSIQPLTYGRWRLVQDTSPGFYGTTFW